jgi:hypothetical protein
MKPIAALLPAIGIAICLVASPAIAKQKPRSKMTLQERLAEYDRRQQQDAQAPQGRSGSLSSLNKEEIEDIGNALRVRYRMYCPAGLGQKYGCQPRGQAKRYIIGQDLPGKLPFWDVPENVIALLPKAPAGSRYIWVDRDIVQVAGPAMKVMDAVQVLSSLE